MGVTAYEEGIHITLLVCVSAEVYCFSLDGQINGWGEEMECAVGICLWVLKYAVEQVREGVIQIIYGTRESLLWLISELLL